MFVFFSNRAEGGDPMKAQFASFVFGLRLVQVFEEVADDVRGFFFVFGFRLYQIGDELKY